MHSIGDCTPRFSKSCSPTSSRRLQDAEFEEIDDCVVEQELVLCDIAAYRRKAFSALHLISEAAFQRGIARMERELQHGPLMVVSRYAILKGSKP